MDLASLLLGGGGGGPISPSTSQSNASGVSFGRSGNAVSGNSMMLPLIIAAGGAVLLLVLVLIRK